MNLSIVGIVLSLLFIVVFALRGWHIILIAPLAVVIAALFSRTDVLPMLTGPYMKGFVNYAGKFYLIFLAASVFGKLMEDSAATDAIALSILRCIGRGSQFRVLLAVAAITMALTLGGVSLFVVIFAVIPVARPLFRELEIPWHLFMAAFFFGIGSVTMTMIPGTPSIINIMPTKYMASTPASAPVVGLVGAVVIVGLNLWYMKIALRRARAAGERYSESNSIEPVRPVTGPAKLPPSLWLSLVPPIVLLLLLNVLKVDPLVALVSAGVACVVLFWRRYENLLQSLNRGATNTVLPIVNTSADVGYGVSIATTSGFKVVSHWLLALPGNPIVSLAAATGLMAGIAGSASGGLGIVLETLAPKYLALGLNPDLVHRISVMAAGTFDALPHNGAVITTLAVANLTHRTAYRHVWWGHVVATIITVALVLPVGILIYG